MTIQFIQILEEVLKKIILNSKIEWKFNKKKLTDIKNIFISYGFYFVFHHI